MSNTAANVSVGKPAIGGAISRAPLGTALPTSATETLAGGFVNLGYISEDGLTNSNAVERESYNAWGGDQVLSAMKGRADNFQFTSIEALNTEVLKAFYGDANVAGTLAAGITVTANANEIGGYVWVVDMILRGGALKRVVIPDGVLSATGDVVYRDNQPVGYQMTLAAMADSSGNTHYEYIQAPSLATVTLSASTASVAAGATTTLTATTSPAGGTVKWNSDDTDVATVTGGAITGVSAGTATITATDTKTGATASASVTVTGA